MSNSLDTDQDRQNVGSDQDPNCLTLVFLKEIFDKVDFEKKQQTAKVMKLRDNNIYYLLCNKLQENID